MNIEDRIDDHPITSGEDLKDDTLLSQARNNFIKKVYCILGIQLMVTTSFVIFNMANEAFAQFQLENQAVFWVALVVSIISLIVLICVPGMATKSPWNVLLLSVFTLAESYMVSMICSLYTPESVLNAAVATLGATVGLTLYAVKTKSDFSDSYSKCYGINAVT
jgi:protein lifeguard